jgi:hypothetical protein
MRTILRHLLPVTLRNRIRAAIVTADDLLHPEMPPQHLRKHISPLWLDFKVTGRDQLEFCCELAELKRTDRVLDIACGCGRFAIPLTRYLNKQGSYEGFDVVPPVIEWCRDHIQTKNPRFRFTIADVATPWSSNSSFTSSISLSIQPPGIRLCLCRVAIYPFDRGWIEELPSTGGLGSQTRRPLCLHVAAFQQQNVQLLAR